MADKKEQNNDELKEEEDPELGALLDAAVKDLSALKQKSEKPSTNTETTISSNTSNTSNSNPDIGAIPDQWSEEFIQNMSKTIEKELGSLLSAGGETQAMDNILESLMNGVPTSENDNLSSDLSNASIEEKLKEVTNSFSSLLNPRTNEGTEASGENNIVPMLEMVMKSFLSKDVLYPVFSSTCENYPKWLESNKDTVSKDEEEKYSKIYSIMLSVVQEFDKEKDDDTEDIKSKRFNTILEKLQTMQSYGDLPSSLLQSSGGAILPNMPNADQCSIM